VQDNNGFVPNDHGNGQKKFPDQGYIPLKDYEPSKQQKRFRKRRNNILLLAIIGLCLMGISNFSMSGTEKEIKLSKDISHLNGGELFLEGRNGTVILEGTEGQKIKLNIVYQPSISTLGKSVVLDIIEDDGKVYLDYDKSKFRSLSIKAEIPEGIFEDIHIKTSNGRLEMAELDSLTALLQTSNAKVDVEGWRGKKLDIKTSNGSVELDDVSGDEVEVNTSNAKVDLELVKGKDMVIQTSNGAINFESDHLDSNNKYRWIFVTSNASVKLDLLDTKEIGYRIDADTSNSIIAHKLDNFNVNENTEKVLNGETGNYDKANIKVDIEIHTSNGTIEIE